MQIVVCKIGQGAIDEVMALNATIVELMKDVDHLKSTHMYMIFETLEVPGMLANLDMPLATTRDEFQAKEVAASDSEVETDTLK